MNLRQLSTLRPTSAEDEQLIQLKFELKAQVTPIEELRSVDVEYGWQEAILAPIIESRMATMPQDNDPTLSFEDQALLDSQDLTKEQELALQAKLDAAKRKKKVHLEDVAPVNVLPEAPAEEQMTVEEAVAAETPAKKTRKAKVTA